ncbi:MAG TPA: hypothetical protein VM692_10360 [Gammaproteobacteria bacterium]|nr:hypothetical protein [Gammaproteobacteria bacterium]
MHDSTVDKFKLRELPELSPPADVWDRVLEAERARRGARRFWVRTAAMAAAAAVVAVGVTAYFVNTPDAPQTDAAPYQALLDESARLEQLLAEMPAPRPLMAGSTASTIVGLENRIAFVDEQLSYAAADKSASPYRQALWGERVELMNALVYVRFAQAL